MTLKFEPTGLTKMIDGGRCRRTRDMLCKDKWRIHLKWKPCNLLPANLALDVYCRKIGQIYTPFFPHIYASHAYISNQWEVDWNSEYDSGQPAYISNHTSQFTATFILSRFFFFFLTSLNMMQGAIIEREPTHNDGRTRCNLF